ncbi:MAG TPA: membrane protein insertase YidC [Bryobacteraceae bacterium]|nr:membrane protein insertase YidC [Bryobacteraceae bacterium]
MSDTPNKPGSPQELSTELRLLIAFALMGLVLFASPYFFKMFAPPPPAKTTQQKTAATVPPSPQTPAPAPSETSEQPAETAEQVAAQKEETFVIETDLYKVVFSNRGAVVKQWILKKYTDENGKLLELVNTVAESKVGAPFSLVFDQRKPAVDLNNALFAAKPSDDGLGISYEYSDGSVVARKTFRFQKSQYIAQVSTEVSENGAPVPHLIAWRGGFGDPSVINPSAQHSTYFDLNDSKLVTHDAKSAKNGTVTSEGNFAFAGTEDTYFAAVFLPANGGAMKLLTFSDTVPTPTDPKEQPRVGAGMGASRNVFSAFVGPKDLDILTKVNSQLARIIDFGWFSFLAKPLFLALHYVNDKWVHNYGWAIIIVTVFINFLLFPLKLSNLKSMKKMQALKPQIDAINQKYKGIGMRDPRKQQQNEEMMALYKKHGANPMGGCLPMLIQIPFFIAFYRVLVVSIELRHAKWLWVTDLSTPEHLAIRILPIAMIATQFFLQKMTPATSVDPSQQRMMLMMPLVMGFIFYGLPSGLVLYYLLSNLVGIAQQVFFNQTVTVADLPQPPPPGKKPNGRNKR